MGNIIRRRVVGFVKKKDQKKRKPPRKEALRPDDKIIDLPPAENLRQRAGEVIYSSSRAVINMRPPPRRRFTETRLLIAGVFGVCAIGLWVFAADIGRAFTRSQASKPHTLDHLSSPRRNQAAIASTAPSERPPTDRGKLPCHLRITTDFRRDGSTRGGADRTAQHAGADREKRRMPDHGGCLRQRYAKP